VNEEADAAADAYWAERDEPRIYRWHAFDWACDQTKIEHRLTKPRCLSTNGQVERMNRTIKDATVKRYHYVSHDELHHHLQLFVEAYNYDRRLKTLRGRTPYEFICQTWTKEPERFRLDPSHHMPGLNTMNANLADYLVEVNADVPEITTISVGVSDLTATALGGKAVGELGIVGVAAIGNAVFHATGRRGRDLPITVQVAPTPDPGPAG